MDIAAALRDTSDALMRDLDVLVAIEEEKRSLEPGDPRLVELAERVDEIARRVLGGTTRQRSLTAIVNARVDAGSPSAPTTSIDETPPRPIATILAEWRDAERQAAAAEEGSADEAEARALAERLRAEYRAAQDAATAANRDRR